MTATKAEYTRLREAIAGSSFLLAIMIASWVYVASARAAELPGAGSIVLLVSLVVLSAIDLRRRLLPNWLTVPLIALGFVQNWTLGDELWPYMLGALSGYLVIWLLAVYWKRSRGVQGIGMGDAKLLAASGSWLGLEMLPGVMLIASAVGLITVGVHAIVLGRGVSSRLAIPFGPFLALGTWFSWCIKFA